MKNFHLLITMLLVATVSHSQNVGIGTASPSGKLHIDQTGTSVALRVGINNAAAISPGVFIVSNAQGGALEAINTATTGLMNGVAGAVSSNSAGTASAGVSGVLGISNATSPGFFSAGVRGVNSGSGNTGMGVIGYHAGSGIGVYGEGGIGMLALARGTNGYGIIARSQTSDDVALMAEYTGTGVATAAVIRNGKLKAEGTNRFAFKHVVTPQNTMVWTSRIDNPLCDGDPNAIIVVTRDYGEGEGATSFQAHVRVQYSSISGKWSIATENQDGFVMGTRFNVIIVSQ